jgi:hypothetical protein
VTSNGSTVTTPAVIRERISPPSDPKAGRGRRASGVGWEGFSGIVGYLNQRRAALKEAKKIVALLPGAKGAAACGSDSRFQKQLASRHRGDYSSAQVWKARSGAAKPNSV